MAREVRDEWARYHSSPSSLMLGFTAQAASDAICLNDGELEDVRWFSREEIASALSCFARPAEHHTPEIAYTHCASRLHQSPICAKLPQTKKGLPASNPSAHP